MIALFIILTLVGAVLLTLVTVVQTCYLEALRLRPRQYDTLTFFEEHLEDSLGVKKEVGALAFSLCKHILLVLLPVPILGISGSLGETALYAFLMMLLFAYMLPQLLYRRSSGTWLGKLAPGLRFFILLSRPLISTLSFMRTIAELTEEESSSDERGNGEIQALIEAGAEEGLIEEDDKRLIRTVIEFKDKTVREVMTPRPNIVAIAEDKTLEDFRQLVVNEKFSRVPVFRGTLDNVVGFAHVRDMFEVDNQQRAKRKVREIVREIDAVPETKPVQDLMREMQRAGKHMVIVVNEYGGTAGLSTMEDLVEEILGEIRDEYEPSQDVTKEADGSYVVSGSYDVDHLHELFQFEPASSMESTTIGGLVTEWMGRVPQAGESVEREGLHIDVLASSELRVDRVRLSRAVEGDGEHVES